MFDVSWSDPERETVGQRKNRKEKEQEASAQSSSSSIRSSKSSKSSDSTRQATRVSLLTFLNGNRKDAPIKGSASPKGSRDDSQRYSTFTDNTVYTDNNDVSGADDSHPSGAEDAYYMTAPDTCSHRSHHHPDGSIFSARTGHSVATNTSWGSILETTRKPSLVQPLSPKSFVTQTTEVTVSSTECDHLAEQVATVVQISSNGSDQVDVGLTPTFSTSPIPFNGGFSQIPSDTLTEEAEEDLLEPSNWPNWQPPDSWKHREDEPAFSVPTLSPPPPRSPLPMLPRHSMSSATKKSRRKPKNEDIIVPSEMTHLQKSIRVKEAATPKIMLERLKEEWMVNADASVYRELELEKQLWVLTALRALNTDDGEDEVVDSGNQKSPPMAQPTKLLSLHENQASASFLSALNPAIELHHLSTAPLQPTSFPNVRPLHAHMPKSQLPYASKIFSAIHSFPLAGGLLPSASVPPMLKEINRTLSSGGRLHLTIIDPSPLPATAGPRLRNWLDTHLITNLEKQFRCLNPSRLFPLWLAEASLRAEGSIIRNLKFKAVVPESDDVWRVGCGGESHSHGDIRVGEELGSVVGRTLWREMWGPWVEGKEWWWEDNEIVEECARMGTIWEYSVIEAVKD
ncbi:hypothetical protein PVAG01_04515 [Phlyctema vagabunda]|uniref:Methyltransferase type 11 domain-containing protein n=1 Tax=Phlyctema vagabunda TaxID=108571 RepID=A0ABR4PPF7_9HELO